MPSRARPDATASCLTCRNSGERTVSSAFANGTTRCSGGPCWRVSPVLVHQVRAGDPLVLGAPAGAMIADTNSDRDVLCLAGGTGLAPLKAIIEALISAPDPGRHREIVLYYGARRHQDLYDLPALQEMELLYPWL